MQTSKRKVTKPAFQVVAPSKSELPDSLVNPSNHTHPKSDGPQEPSVHPGNYEEFIQSANGLWKVEVPPIYSDPSNPEQKVVGDIEFLGIRLSPSGRVFIEDRVFLPGEPIQMSFEYGEVHRRENSALLFIAFRNNGSVFFLRDAGQWSRYFFSQKPIEPKTTMAESFFNSLFWFLVVLAVVTHGATFLLLPAHIILSTLWFSLFPVDR